MMETQKFSWRARARSFRYAFRGIGLLFVREHNARIHLVVAFCVILAGIFFHISPLQWIAVSVCIGGVLSAEAVNSAIESLADRVSPERHPLIRDAKDYAAGAVLVFVFAAVAVGLIIFLPCIIDLFRK